MNCFQRPVSVNVAKVQVIGENITHVVEEGTKLRREGKAEEEKGLELIHQPKMTAIMRLPNGERHCGGLNDKCPP